MSRYSFEEKVAFEPAVHWVFAEDIDAPYHTEVFRCEQLWILWKQILGITVFTCIILDWEPLHFHHD